MEETKTNNKFTRFIRHCWRIISYVVLYTVLQYSVIFVILLIMKFAGAGETGGDKSSASNLLMSLLPIVIMFAIMLKRLGGEWKNNGFWRRDNLSFAKIATGAGIGITMCFILNGSFGVILSMASMGEPERYLMNIAYGISFLSVITVNVGMPVIEEIIFRGTVLKRILEAGVMIPLALIIQGVIFAIPHGDAIQIIYSFFVGIVYSVIYLRTGSIWVSIASHIAFNLFSDIFALIYNICDDVSGIVWFFFVIANIVLFIVLMRIQKKKKTIDSEIQSK